MGVTNFYDYQGVENDYNVVTERDIVFLMSKIFQEYTQKDKLTETKEWARAEVELVGDAYQQLLELSHKSSYFNSDVCKTKEIINFNIQNDRFLTDEELKDRDANLKEADDFLATQMVSIMDSLNDKFEYYKMKCRFTDLSDFAVVRDQALDMEESILRRDVQNDKYSDNTLKQLMSHESQVDQDDKVIKRAGEKTVKSGENLFDRYARRNGYSDRNSYKKVQDNFMDSCKEAGLDMDEFRNPAFKKDEDAVLVGSF